MNPVSDEAKRQAIISHLEWNDSVDSNDVLVDVHQGIARLSGTVPSLVAKTAAEKSAYQIPGIERVDNELKISFPIHQTRPADEEITGIIKSKLQWTSQINAPEITVETTDGIVTLAGQVDSHWQENLIEDIAISTRGVTGVVNDLAVVPENSVEDQSIENSIRSAYRRSSLIDEDKIEVVVNEGVVFLSGTVSGRMTKNQAYDIATYTSGVLDVKDEIKVR